jgi:hypothetical protein
MILLLAFIDLLVFKSVAPLAHVRKSKLWEADVEK